MKIKELLENIAYQHGLEYVTDCIDEVLDNA